MAKVTIVISDNPDGTVRFDCEPNMKEIVGLDEQGATLTDAHVYALRCMNAAQEMSQALGEKGSTSTFARKLGIVN